MTDDADNAYISALAEIDAFCEQAIEGCLAAAMESEPHFDSRTLGYVRAMSVIRGYIKERTG